MAPSLNFGMVGEHSKTEIEERGNSKSITNDSEFQ
jgi:hypothetical protein